LRITRTWTTENYGASSTIVDFEYEYDPNTSNISEMAYAHRGDSNAVQFTYVEDPWADNRPKKCGKG